MLSTCVTFTCESFWVDFPVLTQTAAFLNAYVLGSTFFISPLHL